MVKSFNCSVLSDTFNILDTFSVNIVKENENIIAEIGRFKHYDLECFKVDHLKEYICERKNVAESDGHAVKLWKVNVVEENGIKLKDEDEMNPRQLFSDYFQYELNGEAEFTVTNIHIIAIIPASTGRLTERELFQLDLPFPKVFKLSTTATTKSATRKASDFPLLQWDTFLNDALIASSSINDTDRTFNRPETLPPSISSESSTVNTFLRMMDKINNQRLNGLQEPEMWGKREQCCVTIGRPDVILFRADNKYKLESMNDTKVVATVEVKPERLMAKLVAGIKILDGEIQLTENKDELTELYQNAVDAPDDGTVGYSIHEKIMRIIHQAFGYMVVNKLRYGMITTYARTWFLKRGDPPNANKLYVSPMIPINQRHTGDQPSFLECIHYFEDISRNNPTIDSSQSPPMTI